MRIKLNSINIRIYIGKKNKTNGWFAEQLDVTPQYVSYMLNGQKNPSPQVREKITKVFSGKAWDDLFKINTTTSEVEE